MCVCVRVGRTPWLHGHHRVSPVAPSDIYKSCLILYQNILGGSVETPEIIRLVLFVIFKSPSVIPLPVFVKQWDGR